MVKILTVDDSTFERKAIKSILQKGGYKDVIEAASVEECLKTYKQEKPALVLLDLRMPDAQDGIGALRALMNVDNNARVVVVSIVRDKETIDQCLKLGAKEYVVKPVTENKLLPVVRKETGG